MDCISQIYSAEDNFVYVIILVLPVNLDPARSDCLESAKLDMQSRLLHVGGQCEFWQSVRQLEKAVVG